jgi:hypothetical protein
VKERRCKPERRGVYGPLGGLVVALSTSGSAGEGSAGYLVQQATARAPLCRNRDAASGRSDCASWQEVSAPFKACAPPPICLR